MPSLSLRIRKTRWRWRGLYLDLNRKIERLPRSAQGDTSATANLGPKHVSKDEWSVIRRRRGCIEARRGRSTKLEQSQRFHAVQGACDAPVGHWEYFELRATIGLGARPIGVDRRTLASKMRPGIC